MKPSFLRALQVAVGAAIGLPVSFVGCGGNVVCEDPQAGGILGNINDTCSNGLVTRPGTVSCESTLPSTTTCSVDPLMDTCASDADCTERAHGFCAESGGFDGPGGCNCSYGCVVDDDCGSDALCICGSDIGHCEPANCRIDADCGEGHFCAHWDSNDDPCTGQGWACTTDEDECTVHADCESGATCILQGAKRACVVIDACAIGRPFLIDGVARLARPVGRADWLTSTAIEAEKLGDHERRAAAARWTEIGLMEHASIAAFARFALELLALGAPAELVARASTAMADETRHAKLAFGMASRFAGEAVGPGPLGLAGAFSDTVDRELLLRNVFREGCVGETVAALEASEAAQRSGLSVLSEIANDEADHAALAWSAVAWLLPELGERGARLLEEELERASVRAPDSEAIDPDLERFGLLCTRERARLRAHVLESVVAPAARALIGSARAAKPHAQRAHGGDTSRALR